MIRAIYITRALRIRLFACLQLVSVNKECSMDGKFGGGDGVVMRAIVIRFKVNIIYEVYVVIRHPNDMFMISLILAIQYGLRSVPCNSVHIQYGHRFICVAIMTGMCSMIILISHKYTKSLFSKLNLTHLSICRERARGREGHCIWYCLSSKFITLIFHITF